MAGPERPQFRMAQVAAPECRDMGHAWAWGQGDWRVSGADPGLIERKLTCLRCTSTRSEVIVRRTGAVEHRRYGYATGYRVVGQGRISRDAFRVEALRRAIQTRRN